jgi:hypothetical protein
MIMLLRKVVHDCLVLDINLLCALTSKGLSRCCQLPFRGPGMPGMCMCQPSTRKYACLGCPAPTARTCRLATPGEPESLRSPKRSCSHTFF